MDPYLTTTQKDHRAFTKHELGRYPTKDYATYWECEEYPKAWGHGSKENPLPPNSVPREKGPMRDRIWFKEPTTIPRLPKSHDPVPNKGMKTLMNESYTCHLRENDGSCLAWMYLSPGTLLLKILAPMRRSEFPGCTILNISSTAVKDQ
ncbi:hypothetical protein OS493_020940 [Desmophyllum pertusum]|uniref:Uncharacterized protein n=1 Tax=Desmophyllum pertusum TaxID=174260 RepID=A0A9X0A0K4_9CNID|nr:hypothetical protein OS493_020940 [Desmophyllum pertusum]